MEKHDIPYFRNLLAENINNLQNQCEVWENICMNNSVPDEVLGDIRTNIGLAKLLMNQKLKQFKGLIDDSEFNTGEKEITCLDLQGFWDMVYNEVEKINKCFSRLEKCKKNEWKFEDENTMKPAPKKVSDKREVAAVSKRDDASKFRALAAKQRLAEAKKKMLALREQQKQQNFVEIIKPDSNNLSHLKNLDSEDTNEAPKNESAENSKQDLYLNGKQAIAVKGKDQLESVVWNKTKHKILQASLTPSLQDKENFVPDDDRNESCKKYSSKTQTTLKERNEEMSAKKRGKSKDYGKLQCLTRSAKKALLAQQNSEQES